MYINDYHTFSYNKIYTHISRMFYSKNENKHRMRYFLNYLTHTHTHMHAYSKLF